MYESTASVAAFGASWILWLQPFVLANQWLEQRGETPIDWMPDYRQRVSKFAGKCRMAELPPADLSGFILTPPFAKKNAGCEEIFSPATLPVPSIFTRRSFDRVRHPVTLHIPDPAPVPFSWQTGFEQRFTLLAGSCHYGVPA